MWLPCSFPEIIIHLSKFYPINWNQQQELQITLRLETIFENILLHCIIISHRFFLDFMARIHAKKEEQKKKGWTLKLKEWFTLLLNSCVKILKILSLSRKNNQETHSILRIFTSFSVFLSLQNTFYFSNSLHISFTK